MTVVNHQFSACIVFIAEGVPKICLKQFKANQLKNQEIWSLSHHCKNELKFKHCIQTQFKHSCGLMSLSLSYQVIDLPGLLASSKRLWVGHLISFDTDVFF